MQKFLYSKIWLLCLLSFGMNAWAGDRPYIATTTAVAEEDDDGVWSVATDYQQLGANQTVGGSLEYAFNPTTSVQIEFSRQHDSDEVVTEHEAEIEVKHLFNHIARDGWGWGVSASLVFAKPQDEVWRQGGVRLNIPYSLSLWEGDGFLHLNAGANKPIGEELQWTASAAIERNIFKGTTLFAELAREGEQTLVHSGVRYWVKREKVAIDFSLQKTQGPHQSADGFVIGFNLFDL